MTAQTSRQTRRKRMLKWYLSGPLVCAVSLPLLLYVCALLLAHELLPFGLMEELVIASVFLSGALGGLSAALGRGEKAFQTGLAVGGILAAAIAVITLAVPGEGALSAACLKHVIAAATGGAFGGVLGARRPGGKRRRARRK